jgi:methionyl-tRNA synthetase
MVNKYRHGKLPAAGSVREKIDLDLENVIGDLPPRIGAAYDSCELQQCALLPIELARQANGYIDATRPFTVAKDPPQSERLDTILNLSARAIYAALIALLPVLPEKSRAGLEQLGVGIGTQPLAKLFAQSLPPGHVVKTPQPLFPRVE